MYTKNGGYITWVFSALGKFWGFMNASNSIMSNLCDLPTYAVLLAEYVGQLGHLDEGGKWGIKIGALLLVITLNIVGMEAVSASSILFVSIMLAPFVVEPFLHPPAVENWGNVAPSIDWGVFTGAILWNYQGWDSLGCIAGEVKHAERTYPIGITIALALATVNYALPVMAGAGITTDLDKWDEGGLVSIASSAATWLGAWVLVGAALSVLGEFNAVMGTSSRALQKMAAYGMLPKALAGNWTRFRTPVPAILMQGLVAGVLMMFSFDILVVLDTAFNNLSLVLEVAAFLHLKHKYPSMARPYAVPGRLWGAWLCSIPKFGVIAFGLYSMGFTWQLGVVAGGNALAGCAAYFWAFHYTAGKDVRDEDDPVRLAAARVQQPASYFPTPSDDEDGADEERSDGASIAGIDLPAVPAALDDDSSPLTRDLSVHRTRFP